MYTQDFTGVCFSLLHSSAMFQCDKSLLCDDEKSVSCMLYEIIKYHLLLSGRTYPDWLSVSELAGSGIIFSPINTLKDPMYIVSTLPPIFSLQNLQCAKDLESFHTIVSSLYAIRVHEKNTNKHTDICVQPPSFHRECSCCNPALIFKTENLCMW